MGGGGRGGEALLIVVKIKFILTKVTKARGKLITGLLFLKFTGRQYIIAARLNSLATSSNPTYLLF